MKQHTISTLDGIFVLNPDTGLYEPIEPAERYRHAGWIIIGLGLAALAAAIGAGYAIYRVFEALAV